MRRSIVPKGFEFTAHKTFSDYSNPLSLPLRVTDGDAKIAETSNTAVRLEETRRSSSAENSQCCPICLQSASDPVTLVECSHFFCKECIIKWFQTRLACPLCKVPCTHFIQCYDGKDGQFNLWKTALAGNDVDDVRGTLCKSSMSSGLRRAMKSHRVNLRSKSIHSIISNSKDISRLTKGTNEESRHNLDFKHIPGVPADVKSCTLNLELIEQNDEKPSIDSDISIINHIEDKTLVEYVQSDNLQFVCNELKILEDKLMSEYGS
jgi:Ring finger domain